MPTLLSVTTTDRHWRMFISRKSRGDARRLLRRDEVSAERPGYVTSRKSGGPASTGRQVE